MTLFTSFCMNSWLCTLTICCIFEQSEGTQGTCEECAGRLKEAGLYLEPSKCQFHVQEVEFLGFIVGNNGVRMDPVKVESVTSWPTPKSPHDVRMFLELANFYRRFIRNFSELAKPLTRLLKKDNLARKFRWDDQAQ